MRGTWALERPSHLVTAALGLAVGLLLLTVARPSVTGFSSPFSSPAARSRRNAPTGELPLAFERDPGRSGAEVDFLAHTSAGMTAIGPRGATLALGGPKTTEALGLEFGDGAAVKAQALERLPGDVNYLVGDDRSGRPRSRPSSGSATRGCTRASPSTGTEPAALEYDFRLDPGADPSRIAARMRAPSNCASPQRRPPIEPRRARLRQPRRSPTSRAHGATPAPRRRSPSTSNGRPSASRSAPYDRARPLVIDPWCSPTPPTWAAATRRRHGIAVDATGDAYITGYTLSADFPTAAALQASRATRPMTLFVTKLNPAGNGARLLHLPRWQHAEDRATGIAVDAAGAAYVTGSTASTDFPTVSADRGRPRRHHRRLRLEARRRRLGARLLDLPRRRRRRRRPRHRRRRRRRRLRRRLHRLDRLHHRRRRSRATRPAAATPSSRSSNPAGSALVYSTYLGGTATTWPPGSPSTPPAAAYVDRRHRLDQLPTPSGRSRRDSAARSDAFVDEARPRRRARSATRPTWAAATNDRREAIAVDAAGAAYVTGDDRLDRLPHASADRGRLGGGLRRLRHQARPAGRALVYSTYLGGSGDDVGDGDRRRRRRRRLRHRRHRLDRLQPVGPDRGRLGRHGRLRLEAQPRRQRARLLDLPGRQRRRPGTGSPSTPPAPPTSPAYRLDRFRHRRPDRGRLGRLRRLRRQAQPRRRRRRGPRRRRRMPDRRGTGRRTAAAARLGRRRRSRRRATPARPRPGRRRTTAARRHAPPVDEGRTGRSASRPRSRR